ncbi:hypothetical protein D3C78_456500 [compost metagenome]
MSTNRGPAGRRWWTGEAWSTLRKALSYRGTDTASSPDCIRATALPRRVRHAHRSRDQPLRGAQPLVRTAHPTGSTPSLFPASSPDCIRATALPRRVRHAHRSRDQPLRGAQPLVRTAHPTGSTPSLFPANGPDEIRGAALSSARSPPAPGLAAIPGGRGWRGFPVRWCAPWRRWADRSRRGRRGFPARRRWRPGRRRCS